jgi:hypothetical protein
MPGVDYEATQKERDAARNERAKKKSRDIQGSGAL